MSTLVNNLNNMDNITWIKGYEGQYSINKNGDVMSYKYKIAKQLKRNVNTQGYEYYKLSNGSKLKNYTIHKLVASTFIGLVQDNMQVNHIDGNKLNNNLLNLEYVTPSENIHHAYNNKLMANVFKGLKEKNSRVLIDTQTGVFYDSIKEASELLCINYSKLMNMICGAQKNKTNLNYA